jgi:hypothetical protein
VIGARDTLSGLSMLLAPAGAPLQAAVAGPAGGVVVRDTE